MASSVREHVGARQAGCPCHVFRFSALAQLSSHIGSAVSSHGVLLAVLLVAVALVTVVIFPAVWSRKSYRRKAALEVLERLIRWRG